jgi:hypothetical protein
MPPAENKVDQLGKGVVFFRVNSSSRGKDCPATHQARRTVVVEG